MAGGSESGAGRSETGKAGVVRIGVGARLFGALAFNGLVAFLIGLGAYIAFDGLHAGITKVTSEQFPAVVASAKLERQHQRIMRTLEQLALSDDNFGRETIKQGLADQLDGYDRMLADMESSDAPQARRIAGLKQQRDEILRLRDAIDRGVTARVAARRALADRSRDVRRMADALAEPGLRGIDDLGVQRWLAMAERLLFLIASVHQMENSFALARLADSAAAQLESLAGSVPQGLADGVSDRLTRLAEAMRAVVEGERSVFGQRQAELQASEALNGLVDRANQVSLVNTGLNTGIFVEQTKAAEESRQQVIEVSTTYTRLFFASVGVVMLGMVLSVLYVRRKVLARLWAVSEAIRNRTEGGGAEVPATGADEIGELARALRFYIQETEDKSKALRRNEQWLRTVLEAAPVPLVISGRADGQIRFVNRRAADLFEAADAGELLGRPDASVWYVPAVREEFVRDVFASGLALDVETELVTRSGRRLWGLLSGIAFEFQGEEVLLSSVVDITRRREAEELLRRTQAFLDAVIDNVPSVLYVLEGDTGRVVLWNRAAEDCFGTPRADIEDRTLAEVLGPETGRALAGGDPGSMRSLGVEELALARNGETAVFALQRHPFEWSGDGRCRIICVANDVTASRRAREELRQAKERAERADAAKTEFLATVSHEMRTPLNGILGLCRLLLTGQLHAGERRYAMSIMRCGHGLLDQVNDILDLRKIEDGKLDLDPAPCALLPVLEEVVATVEGLANEKGIDLDLDIAPDVPVGLVLNAHSVIAASDKPEDQAAAERAHQFHNGAFFDPVFKGQYPDQFHEALGARMPAVEEDDLKIISQKLDWWGLNYYTPMRVAADRARTGDFPWTGDAKPVSDVKTDIGWEVYSPGLKLLVEDLYRRYDLPDCYITENGACYNMEVVDGEVDDQPRLDYYVEHLSVVADLIVDNYPMKGYFAWSLMDNFEWAEGYRMRFGLVHVDYETQERTVKKSGTWYRQLAAEFPRGNHKPG